MRACRSTLALTTVLIALGLSACGKSAGDALASAKERIAKNDDTAAEIDLKNYLQTHPDSGEARFLLGQQAQKRGDGAAALIELQRALDLKHPDGIVVPAIVKSLLAQGRFKQIIDEFGKAELSDRVATAEVQGLVAQAMQFDGDTQGATEMINKAAAGAPDSEPVQLIKASLDAEAGRSTQALAVLDGLIARKPDSHLAWTMKGNVLGVMPDQRDAALVAFRKALALKPGDITPRTGVIALSLMAGDLDAATTELAALQKQAPKHPNTQFYEASLAFARGKYTEAQSLYQGVLRLLPLHPAVLLGAAENELKLNALAQAESLAAKALTQSPDNVRARQLLARVYLRTGQPAKAVAALANLVDSPRVGPDTLALAAQAQLMNGNVGAADLLYSRAAKLNPTDPQLRTLLATVNLGKASNDQALTALQSISAEDKGASADQALVSARLRAGQYDAALQAVETLIKKKPDQAMSYQLKAQALSGKNDLAGARQALEQALAKEPTYLRAVLGLATLDMRSQKPDLARQRIEDLLKQQPTNAQALVALAELSAEAGQPPKEVVGHLERAAQMQPSETDIWVSLIDQHQKFGNPRAALTAAQAAVAANPKSIQLLDRLGRTEMRNGQSDQALSSFGKITSLHPKSLVGLLGQAEVQIASGNLAEAGRTLNKVLERDPQNQPALALAFGSALQQQQYKPAFDIARKVQQQRPADAGGWLMEAEVEARQGRRDAAIALWRKALPLNGPGQAPIRLQQALVEAGKTAEADALATTWAQSHPADLDFQLHLAAQARQQGKDDLAEQRFRQVLKQQPAHAAALNDLAMVLLRQGKPEAVPVAERALKYRPDDPALLDTLAHAQAATQQWPLALDTQRRAVLLAPDQPALRLALAQLEFKSGDKAAARRSLDGVLSQSSKLGADDRAAMTTLAKALNPA